MAALPPRHRQPHHDDDQADLQDQAEDRRQAAEAGEHPAAEQHAEQAGAEEARGEAAEHAHAGPVEEAALGAPAAAGAPIPGLPGWVKVRFMGCAVLGAVVVVGGAEKVRVPREPELPPPPTRASADEIAITSGTASDRTTAMA